MNDTVSVSLKEFFSARFTFLEKRLDEISDSLEQFKRQTDTYITKQEYEARHQILETKIENLQRLAYMILGMGVILEVGLRFFVK